MSTNSATTASAPKLVINRRLNAPVERVYAAWTDPAKIVQWFGPSDEMTCEVPELELTVGGRYAFLMLSPSGDRHCVMGEYREIVENERLVFSWAWESTPERVSQVTVTFRADGDATQLQLTHEQFVDEEARDRHQQGWTPAIDRLVARILEI